MALPLFEFLRRDRRSSLSLIVSLDGSRAGAALLDSSGEKPALRFSTDIEIAADDQLGAEALLGSLLEKLKVALALAKEKGLPAQAEGGATVTVKEAVAFVGAPWCDTSIKRLCVAKETPMTLTRRSLDRILDRNEFALKLGSDLDEKVLARASVNGYTVGDPVGLRASAFELSLFLAAVEPAAKEGVSAIVEEIFPGVKLSFASQSRALFELVRDLYPHEGHTLVLDVGGELIEAVRIEGDDLGAIASAPIGVLSAVRGISKRCQLSSAAAAAALRAHAESGDAAPECPEGVSREIAETAAAWGASIQKNILSGTSGVRPGRVVVSADPSVSETVRSVVAAALPEAEILLLSARMLESAISADPSAHPTTISCALALHSQRQKPH